MRKKIRKKGVRTETLVAGDKVIASTEHAYDVASQHRGPVLVGVAILLAVVAIVAGTSWYLKERARSAQVAHGAAAKMADRAEAGPSAAVEGEPVPEPPPSWTAVAEAFTAVAEEHGGQPPGVLASYQAGVARLRAGQPAEAIAVLSKFLDEHGDHWAAPHALTALASAHEAAGDAGAAEKDLARLRDGSWRSFPPGAGLMLLGQLYERQDRTPEAVAIYRQLADEDAYDETSYKSLAEARLLEL